MRTMELRAEPAKRKPGARTSYGMPSLDGGHPAKYPLCFPLFASASVRGGNSCPNASHARIASAHVLPGKRPGRIFRSDRAIPSDSMASDSVRSQPAHRVARQTHLQGVQTLTSTPIRECRPAAWAWRLRPRRADVSSNPPGRHAANLDTRGWWRAAPCISRSSPTARGSRSATDTSRRVTAKSIRPQSRLRCARRLQLTVRKDMKLTWPRAETPTDYISMATESDLNVATPHSDPGNGRFPGGRVEADAPRAEAHQPVCVAGNVAIRSCGQAERRGPRASAEEHFRRQVAGTRGPRTQGELLDEQAGWPEHPVCAQRPRARAGDWRAGATDLPHDHLRARRGRQLSARLPLQPRRHTQSHLARSVHRGPRRWHRGGRVCLGARG